MVFKKLKDKLEEGKHGKKIAEFRDDGKEAVRQKTVEGLYTENLLDVYAGFSSPQDACRFMAARWHGEVIKGKDREIAELKKKIESLKELEFKQEKIKSVLAE